MLLEAGRAQELLEGCNQTRRGQSCPFGAAGGLARRCTRLRAARTGCQRLSWRDGVPVSGARAWECFCARCDNRPGRGVVETLPRRDPYASGASKSHAASRRAPRAPICPSITPASLVDRSTRACGHTKMQVAVPLGLGARPALQPRTGAASMPGGSISGLTAAPAAAAAPRGRRRLAVAAAAPTYSRDFSEKPRLIQVWHCPVEAQDLRLGCLPADSPCLAGPLTLQLVDRSVTVHCVCSPGRTLFTSTPVFLAAAQKRGQGFLCLPEPGVRCVAAPGA